MTSLKCLYSKLVQWFSAFNVDFQLLFAYFWDFCLFDYCWGLLFSRDIEIANTEKLGIFMTFNFFFFFLNIFFNIYITSLRKRKSISQILLGLWFFKTCRNQHNQHQKNDLNYLLDLNYFRRNVNEIKLQAIFEKPDMPL